MTSPRVNLLPPGADLLDQAAQRLVERHRDSLPDLSRVTVLLPFHSAAPRLRRALVRHAGRGLLGPRLQTLSVFAHTRAPTIETLPALDCRLRLTSALARHRHLFPGVGHVQAADALYGLFEEFITQGVALDDEAGFTARLQAAYRAPSALPFLSTEAQIAHRLFAAYLQDTGGRSPAAIYRQQCAAAFASLSADESLYLLGFDEFTPAERTAVNAAVTAGRAELWLQGRRDGHDGKATDELCRQLGLVSEVAPPVASPHDALFNAAFSEDTLPAAPTHVSAPTCRLVHAHGPEHEARCVDLAVREALLAGATSVSVVSQDRRLARRLRALLERAGIALDDPAGWALSTSSAAACISAWLDCRAQDFGFRALLSLLKSDFSKTSPAALRTLDRELIHTRGIEYGIEAYRRAAGEGSELHALLSTLHVAAERLPTWHDSKSGDVWCRSLQDSLTALGLWARLQADAAGAQLTALIEDLGRALREHRLMLDGDGFRELLDRLLERETFVPARGRGPVQLLTLEQSQNLRSDVLILTGVTREQLPGQVPAEPLFNARVRAELGLKSWESRQALGLARLRRLLQSAPSVLMTYAPSSPTEEAVLSPWIEALEATALAAGHTLRDPHLLQRATHANTEISDRSTAPPPATARPAPRAAPALIPTEISASAHQSLVDCPYQFFASRLLGLRAERAPDEDPDRSEYGQRVHRILQRFSESGPATHAAEISARLQTIADDVFAPDLRAHALAQLWQAEFRSQLPLLCDWLLQRPPTREVQCENKYTQTFGTRSLSGTVDRLEIGTDGRRTVVDYKTGAVPKEEALLSGEAVQLLHYAALDPAIARVEYLALKEGQKSLTVEDGLPELREQVMQRLRAAVSAMEGGHVLSPHGDDTTCERCDYRGLCRKGDWASGDFAAHASAPASARRGTGS